MFHIAWNEDLVDFPFICDGELDAAKSELAARPLLTFFLSRSRVFFSKRRLRNDEIKSGANVSR